MSFSQKAINVQFSLANGQFSGGGNSAAVTGLRVEAQIEATAGVGMGTAEIAIYGMDPSVMNQLATIGSQFNARYQNGITIFAGDDSGTSLVFDGVIFTGVIDGKQMPDTCFRIVASPSTFVQVKPMTPISVQGSADAAGLMSQLAGLMGLSFQNNGVSVKLSNPYYAGTAWQSALEIAEHCGFDVAVERKTMVISPRGSPTSGQPFKISAGVNMVGYPAFIQNRISVTAEFDTAVSLFSLIEVESSLKGASGTWQATNISYDLQSLSPDGNWFMNIEAVPSGTT